MSENNLPTPPPQPSDPARVAMRSIPPRQGCRCDSRRPAVWNRPYLAYVCPECGGYRRNGRR